MGMWVRRWAPAAPAAYTDIAPHICEPKLCKCMLTDGRRDGRTRARTHTWASRQAGWLAGCQAGWQAGWLAGRQAGWLAGRQAGRQAGGQAGRQAGVGWIGLLPVPPPSPPRRPNEGNPSCAVTRPHMPHPACVYQHLFFSRLGSPHTLPTGHAGAGGGQRALLQRAARHGDAESAGCRRPVLHRVVRPDLREPQERQAGALPAHA
eukprot:161239-Chlamydomonas_euryale.AAC.2